MSEIRTAATRGRVPVAIAAAAALLIPAGWALGEPALPQTPADGAVAESLRPTFSWTPGSSGVPIAGYEVFVETAAGPMRVAAAPAGTLTATADTDLADDTRYRWFVRLTNTLGGVANTPVASRAEVQVATAPAAPTITDGPTGTIASGRPVFAWTGVRPSSRWVVMDGSGAPVRSGGAPSGSGRAEIAALPDGVYVFRVAQDSGAGREGAAATRAFTVDLSAPPAPAPVAGSGAPRSGAPAFSWAAGEPGAVATWRVRGPGGAVVAGPAETLGATATPGRLAAGAYVFEVRLTDATGNSGEWGSEPFSVAPAAAPPLGTALSRATRTGASLGGLRRNARRLSPEAGRRLATRRPVLRWEAGPAGTRLYNVQLFRVAPAGRLVKVASAFPVAARYAVPGTTPLAAGACYLWRVWPYRAGGYAPVPLGVSDFCVAAKG